MKLSINMSTTKITCTRNLYKTYQNIPNILLVIEGWTRNNKIIIEEIDLLIIIFLVLFLQQAPLVEYKIFHIIQHPSVIISGRNKYVMKYMQIEDGSDEFLFLKQQSNENIFPETSAKGFVESKIDCTQLGHCKSKLAVKNISCI